MGARDELYCDDPGIFHFPAGALQPLRRRARRNRAGQAFDLVRAAGAGSAAHRAADCRCCPFVADSRRSCVADGGTVPGHHAFSSTRSCLIPSRKSKCPRSCLTMFLCEPLFAIQSWAEQLVEVPTIVSFSSSQRIVEQNVAIPVPGGGGRLASLQGFLPGQSSTAPTVAQIVDSPAPGGGLQGFRPGKSSSSSSHFPAGLDD